MNSTPLSPVCTPCLHICAHPHGHSEEPEDSHLEYRFPGEHTPLPASLEFGCLHSDRRTMANPSSKCLKSRFSVSLLEGETAAGGPAEGSDGDFVSKG